MINETLPCRNKATVNGKLTSVLFDGVNTLTESFEYICKKKTKKTLYLYRELKEIHIEKDPLNNREIQTKEFGKLKKMTFEEGWRTICEISRGLNSLFPQLKKGDKVGVYLETRVEWILVSHALFQNSIVVVTMYPDLSIEGLVHIINECCLSVILTNSSKVEFLEKNVLPKCESLESLIILKTKENEPRIESDLLKIVYYSSIVREGQSCNTSNDFGSKPQIPNSEELAFMMYTSGTTSSPKGVTFSHAQLLASLKGLYDLVIDFLTENDRYLSYLPLSHIFEFVSHHTCIFCGLKIGMGSPRSLIKKRGGAKYFGDLELIKPTGIVIVPRIFEIIKKGVIQMVRNQPKWKQSLFNSVLKKRIIYLKEKKRIYNGIMTKLIDKFVFKKIRKLFGGNLRVIISGSAPLNPDSQLFFQSILGKAAIIFQGYGLTECGSCALAQDYFVQRDECYTVGNVGFPLTSVEIKLVDVPELNYYTAKENVCGEICVFGNNISNGYFKLKKQTEETFQNGWLKTGDIGQLHADGSFSIIDRKKNICKLQNGEYVALEFLESIYGCSDFVQPSGLCITPNSLKAYLGCVIMIQSKVVLEWAKKNGEKDDASNLNQLCESEKLIKAVLEDFDRFHKKKGLKSYERIKKVILKNDIFDPINGTMTASNKLKRKVISDKYKMEIEDMYNDSHFYYNKKIV